MNEDIWKLVSLIVHFKAEYGHFGIGHLIEALNEADPRLICAIDESLREMRAD